MRALMSNSPILPPTPAEPGAGAELLALLRARLHAAGGWLGFDDFMALALYFTYKCKDYIHILAIGFPKLLQYVKKDWVRPKDFIYYRISDVLNTCISMIVQYKRRLSIEERRDLWQFKIRLD